MEEIKKIAKILVVDDSSFDLQLVSWVLKEGNYETLEANNGLKALEILKSEIPDLILLDVMMPDLDGFSVCQQIKKQEHLKDIPIIFFTTLKNTQDIVKGFEFGGVDYVTKPFNKEELIVRVKNHIDLINSKKQLELQTQQLLQANSLKDKMFSVIAHDLRSPMGTLKMVLDSLRLGLIDPATDLFKETIEDLSKTNEEANVLLENLLGWARSQSNTLKIFPEKLDINDLVSSVIRLQKLACETKKITIENNIPEETYTWADMQVTQAVLRNLLSNAVKFTYVGGSIFIDSLKRDNELEILVSDTGVGIPEKSLANIFNPQSLVKTFGTSNETGSGLGLLLCKDFVKKSGGEIWVESTEGEGSTFHFTLPMEE